MKRMMVMAGGAAALLLWAAPVLAAEEGGTPASPLYGPSQGVISGAVTIVVFILLLAVLGKYAWKPIVKGLEDRENRIRKDLADAEAARAQAEAALRDYNAQLSAAETKVRDLLAKASVDAEKIATSIRMQAQQEGEEIKERTNRELEAARRQAMAEFRQYAATVATQAAQQILRRNLNEQDQLDLVNRSLDQLESVKA